MLRKTAYRRAGLISVTLPLAFLASCGSSGGEKLFDTTTAGSSSAAGRSNAQSGGAAVGTGGSLSAGSGGAGISGAASGGAAGGALASRGGAAAGGAANPSGGSTMTTGGRDAAGGSGASDGGSEPVSAGGSEPASAGGSPPQAGSSGSPSGGGGSGGQTVEVTGGVGGGVFTGGSGGASPCTPVDERCDGVDNNCNGVADEGKACPTDCEGFAIEGHGYMFCSSETALGKGQLACEGQGLRLAWIETPEENQALVTNLKSMTKSGSGQGPVLGTVVDARIGASDAEEEGEWHWMDGIPFWTGGSKGKAVGGAYENWSPQRPNDSGILGQDCATLLINKSGDGAAGEWTDIPCSEQHAVLCEVP